MRSGGGRASRISRARTLRGTRRKAHRGPVEKLTYLPRGRARVAARAGTATSPAEREQVKAALRPARRSRRTRPPEGDMHRRAKLMDRRELPWRNVASKPQGMRAVFADPKTDFVFKRIFGVEERKPLLIALLNHVLELEGSHQIRDVQHLGSDQHVDVAELKLSIVDVKCTDETGRKFVVEMQVLNVEGVEKRVVYNASKAYVMQLRNGEGYPALCDVVGVTICNFELWPTEGAAVAGDTPKVPMLSRWRMQEQHGGVRGLSQVQYVFMELPKYSGGLAPAALVDKWALFFREAKNWDVIPEALSEGPFREALDVARVANFTPAEWDAYERSKMAEQDARGALTLARAEAEARPKLLPRQDSVDGEVLVGFSASALEGARGEAKGAAKAVLAVLEARGVVLTVQQRATVVSCADVGTLERWLRAAVHVAEGAALFA